MLLIKVGYIACELAIFACACPKNLVEVEGLYHHCYIIDDPKKYLLHSSGTESLPSFSLSCYGKKRRF